MSRMRRWGKRTLYLASCVCVLSLGLEIALHAVGWRPKLPLFVNDPRLGRRLLPNLDQDAWGGRVLTDAEGYRTAGTERRAGVPRVLFLGGSITFGYGLDWDDTYPAQFQRLMTQESQDLDVVNAGVPLGTTANGCAFLFERGDEVRPSMLVVCYGINDLGVAMYRGWHHCFIDGHIQLHRSAPADEVKPVPDDSPDPARVSFFRSPAFLKSLYHRICWYLFAQKTPALGSFLRTHPPFTWLYRRNPDKYEARLRVEPLAAPHGFQTYQDNLRTLIEWARRRKVPLLLIDQPRRGQQDLFALLPEEARAKTRLALRLMRDKGPADALPMLREVVSKFPAYILPRYNLAVALVEAGLVTEAEPLRKSLLENRTLAHCYLTACVANEQGVPIVHAELVFEPLRAEGLFLGDGLHFSRRGNEVVASELVRVLHRSEIHVARTAPMPSGG